MKVIRRACCRQREAVKERLRVRSFSALASHAGAIEVVGGRRELDDATKLWLLLAAHQPPAKLLKLTKQPSRPGKSVHKLVTKVAPCSFRGKREMKQHCQQIKSLKLGCLAGVASYGRAWGNYSTHKQFDCGGWNLDKCHQSLRGPCSRRNTSNPFSIAASIQLDVNSINNERSSSEVLTQQAEDVQGANARKHNCLHRTGERANACH